MDITAIGELAQLGIGAVSLVLLAVLWRAYQAKDERTWQLIQELRADSMADRQMLMKMLGGDPSSLPSVQRARLDRDT